MRALLTAPIVLLLTAGAGYAICRTLGIAAHTRELLIACSIAMVASVVGLVPLILVRGASQPAVAQAGLVATAAHLFVAIALAGVMMLAFQQKFEQMFFVYWLLAFYWVTLIGIVIAAVVATRRAPVQPIRPTQ